LVLNPKKALKRGITGNVYVFFSINKEGKIVDVSIKKGVNELLDNEALRVVKAMPDWIPGKDKNGKNVKVEMTFPINFMLN